MRAFCAFRSLTAARFAAFFASRLSDGVTPSAAAVIGPATASPIATATDDAGGDGTATVATNVALVPGGTVARAGEVGAASGALREPTFDFRLGFGCNVAL
mmetsp:Transcript_15978/g.34692  ORF Transcript_15978/g.34692 Transcript_15978/m.34692 type:complete len:101 (-) Transcript_15978:268-570(-)